jgi:hypothetical protein
MSSFNEKHFRKFSFSEEDIERSFENALRDLEIALKDPFAEVRFSYAYQALLKAGITLLAKLGSVKVQSVPGHHIKILEKMSEIMGDEDIFTIGNAMRMKRNADLYSGGESVSEKEADDYCEFVVKVIGEVRKKVEDNV